MENPDSTDNQSSNPQETVQANPSKSKPQPLVIITLILTFFLVAAGSFVLGKYWSSLQEQPQITQNFKKINNISPSPTIDPTLDWKTYTNEKAGFSLKYPPEWIEKPFKIGTSYPLYGLVSLSVNNNQNAINNQIQISYWDNPDRLSLMEMEEKYKGEGQGPNIYFPNGISTTISGTQAYKGENVGCDPMKCDRITIIKNDKIIEIKSLYITQNIYKNTFDQILSTFRFLEENTTSITPSVKTGYIVPSVWKKTTMKNGLILCLPPKWEYNGFGDLEFNRDPGYKPTITTIQEIPYSGGSKRQAYFDYWRSEYPDVQNLVSVKETDINGNNALTIYSATPQEVKSSPDGFLAVVWYANNKLWKAGLSSWHYINDSQTAFLNDFYTAISCSF